jgi:site-specific DNA-methyltransferase (adenine-specific)
VTSPRQATSARLRPRGHWISKPADLTSASGGEVVCCDALEVVASLKPEVADVVFIDPPFNLGKLYGQADEQADRLTDASYFEYLSALLERLAVVLRPGGTLFLYHIPRWAVRFAAILDQRLEFRHWIAISMKNGFARGDRLYPAHYALLYFSKGRPAHFRRPKLQPAHCRHCHKLLRDYGGYLKFVRNGINLSDIWADISPVRHRRHKTRQANELPTELVRRIMAISAAPDGLFLDPFAGSGTAILAAREAKMRFIAIDREAENCELIRRRLRSRGTHQ